MEKRLGKLTKVDNLRDYWPHEALDFTPWLAEEGNIASLSEAVGLDIVVEETESSVGSFNVDILARERYTDKVIIIENQLEETDHDHLGKIITYASGKDASFIIWVVRKAREEHRAAVEWLNSRTDDGIGFFLIETELWSIDGSDAAVRFQVIEQPNGWVKEIKRAAAIPSEIEKLRFQFWSAYVEYAFADTNYARNFRSRKPGGRYYYDLIPVGIREYQLAFFIDGRANRIGVEVYIPDNKERYKLFLEHKIEIESHVGSALDWRDDANKKACRIVMRRDGDLSRQDAWNQYFEWMKVNSLKLLRAFRESNCG